MKKVLNERNGKCSIFFLFFGFALILFGGFWYYSFYHSVEQISINEIWMLFVFVTIIVLGFILVLVSLNLKSIVSKVILLILLALFITLIVLFTNEVLYGLLILTMSFVIFIIVKTFYNFVATIINAVLFMELSFLLMLILGSIFNSDDKVKFIVYVSVTLSALLFVICGSKMKWLINRFIFGEKIDKSEITYEDTKNQLNLVYLIFFILINLLVISDQSDGFPIVKGISEMANNALITGVCLTNINWKQFLPRK